MHWRTTRYLIDLARPRVMGIVNVTPDSFSDGVRGVSDAIRHAESLLAEGADMLDIGGESSRPGADPVSAHEEWRRVGPVLKEALRLQVPVSVDTCKPEVMQRALALGVDIVNDIGALRADGALAVVAAHPQCGVCLMHMQGEPKSMQAAPAYDDVVVDVCAFLAARAEALYAAGVGRERIVVDPGIGFGKRVDDNFSLLPGQRQIAKLGFPILAGWSRKSSLGAVTGRPVEDRLVASVAAALAALQWGARVVRVHDVAATVDAFKVWERAGLMPHEGADSV